MTAVCVTIPNNHVSIINELTYSYIDCTDINYYGKKTKKTKLLNVVRSLETPKKVLESTSRIQAVSNFKGDLRRINAEPVILTDSSKIASAQIHLKSNKTDTYNPYKFCVTRSRMPEIQ